MYIVAMASYIDRGARGHAPCDTPPHKYTRARYSHKHKDTQRVFNEQ